MIVKGPKDVQIGNLYMYIRWNNLASKLKRGVCVGITETTIKLQNPDHTYLGDDEVKYIAEHYPKVEYSMIADYDKRLFNAYNKRIEQLELELKNIWNGKLKRERKRKKKGFWKRWFKRKDKQKN